MRSNQIGWGLVAASLFVAANALAIGGAEPIGDPKNGLSSAAFRENALTLNKDALDELRTKALDDTLINGPKIGPLLRDPNARAVMEEIVECALGKTTTLQYVDPLAPNPPHRWTGELGLCELPEAGPWSSRAPTEACLQLVTACVMSRVNGLKKAIPLSMRGRPDSAFALVDRVFTVPVHRENVGNGEDPTEGTPISSFAPSCAAGQDCKWSAAHVGKCQPGEQVRLALEPASAASSTELRICAGIHGCNNPATTPDPTVRPYSGFVNEAAQGMGLGGVAMGTSAEYEFACPSGTYAGGYYSVMFRGPGNGSISVKKVSPKGSYPASEREVFAFPEGAFYGNMFDSSGLTKICVYEPQAGVRCDNIGSKRRVGAPNTNVYACYSFAQQQNSANGSLGVAYLNSRICDLPDADCFFHPPVPCTGGAGTARCKLQAGADAYQDCAKPDEPGRTFLPITTYLNEPCDLIGEQAGRGEATCRKLRALTPNQLGIGQGKGKTWRCGGCSRSGATSEGLLSVAGVAFLVLIVSRRRRRAA